MSCENGTSYWAGRPDGFVNRGTGHWRPDGRITASLHRKRLAHDSCGKSETSLARRFRLGGKKEGAGAAVAVMLSGIMDIEYDPDFR